MRCFFTLSYGFVIFLCRGSRHEVEVPPLCAQGSVSGVAHDLAQQLAKAATALVKAQRRLKQLRPDLSLKVYDAARPMHIQQKMWDAVKNTSKDIYVSNPAHGGGMHNYGLAVDITLCDAKGDTLDMGTKIDYMGRAAHIDAEQQLVAAFASCFAVALNVLPLANAFMLPSSHLDWAVIMHAAEATMMINRKNFLIPCANLRIFCQTAKNIGT